MDGERESVEEREGGREIKGWWWERERDSWRERVGKREREKEGKGRREKESEKQIIERGT